MAEALLKSAIQANPKQYGYLTTLAMHYSMMGRREDMADDTEADPGTCPGLRSGLHGGR